MENFMEKLVGKINAQDIIRANGQAEAVEAERIKQEAEQYKSQLEELRLNEKEHRSAIEDTKASLEEAKASIEESKDSLSALSKRMDENDVKVHDVGVQIYRNVQAVVEKSQARNKEEFKEIDRKLESLLIISDSRNRFMLPMCIIILLVSGADLVINILRLLGII